MRVNMGLSDRRVRAFVVAPVLIVIALVVGIGSVAGIVLLALAAVMLATSAVGFCPLYTLFKIDTRSHRKSPHSGSA
jgi:hypothetical protein